MATCKDCVHVEVCCSFLSTAYNKCKLATPDFKLLKNIECDECQHFKDRSRFVELPCKLGDTVYYFNRMPTEPTPRKAIIKLNRIRTNTGERPPEIDMAIRAINCCMIKRKPDLNIHDDPLCPNCRAFVKMFTGEFCPKCGQALDWTN